MNNIHFERGAIDAGSCITNGWELVKPNYWMYFGITIVAVLLISCIPCLNFFILGPVGVGVYYVLLRAMRGEQVEFGMMFKGFEKFVPAMVVGVVQSIPGLIWTAINYAINIAEFLSASRRGAGGFQSPPQMFAGYTLLYGIFAGVFVIVAAVWGISFMFSLPILAEHDISPMDALKLSARAAWSNIGGIILLAILQVLLVMVGMIALCVGVFFVIPVLYAAMAFAYRQVFPSTGGALNHMPPPPPVFGQGSY